jgi:O-antigen ligase
MGFLAILILFYSLLAYGGVSDAGWAVIQLSLFTSLFIFMIKSIRKGSLEILPSPFHAGAALMILLVIYQLSGLPGGSVYPYATRTAFLRYISYYLYFFLVINIIKNKKDIFRLAGSVLIFALFLSFWEVGRRMDFIASNRVFFVNPNHYATWLLMAVIFTFAFFLASRKSFDSSKEEKNKKTRLRKNLFTFLDTPQPVFFILSVFASVGLFFSLSRGGIASFTGGIIILGALVAANRAFKSKAPVILPFAIVLFMLLFWLGADRVFTEFSRMKPGVISSDARLSVWGATLEIAKDFPAAGSGLGTFYRVFPAYKSPQYARLFFTHAHNEYLELLSETGISGFLIVFLSFILYFKVIILRFFKHRSRAATAFTASSAAAVSGALMHAFFDFPFRIPANGLLFSLILAIGTVSACGKFKADGEIKLIKKTIKIKKPVLSFVFISLLFLFLSFLAIRPALAGRIALSNPKLAARIEPSNAGHHYLAAREYLDNPGVLSYQQAFPHLKRAVELDKRNSRYRQSLGWVYAVAGDFERAREELSLALALDPSNPVRQNAYSFWFGEDGKFHEFSSP